MWSYKGRHLVEPQKGYYGFIYKITHKPTGKSYIGKKSFYHNIKKKLTQKELSEQTGRGRRALTKVISKESDWKRYYGSSQQLKDYIKENGTDDFHREVLQLARTKKELTYLETKYLFSLEVLEKPDDYYNDNILGKFFRRDLL